MILNCSFLINITRIEEIFLHSRNAYFMGFLLLRTSQTVKTYSTLLVKRQVLPMSFKNYVKTNAKAIQDQKAYWNHVNKVGLALQGASNQSQWSLRSMPKACSAKLEQYSGQADSDICFMRRAPQPILLSLGVIHWRITKYIKITKLCS